MAIKVVHALPANDPEIVECFLGEVRVFARVQKGQSALAPRVWTRLDLIVHIHDVAAVIDRVPPARRGTRRRSCRSVYRSFDSHTGSLARRSNRDLAPDRATRAR